MKKILNIIAGESVDLKANDIDLDIVNIQRIWTLYDEKLMWDSCKFNPFTGKKVKSLDDLHLQHHKGVFLEDVVHDWRIRKDNLLDYYSRVVNQGDCVKILIEYEYK